MFYKKRSFIEMHALDQSRRATVDWITEITPDILQDPDHVPLVTGFAFRAPKKLHVRWDA